MSFCYGRCDLEKLLVLPLLTLPRVPLLVSSEGHGAAVMFRRQERLP